VKGFLLFLVPWVILVSCSKKAVPEKGTNLPDLEISLEIPPGMEAAPEDALKQLQAASAEYPPILPFRDFPCYEFHNPVSGSTLSVSRLTFADPETAERDPISIMEEYRKSLESYYGVDNIAVNEFIGGDHKLTVMNFVYVPGGETIYLTKVLYYKYPQRYILLDIYYDIEKISQEEAEAFEAMLQSIKTLPR
jgi:hypothetical protein